MSEDVIELIITITDEEKKKLSNSFLTYEPFTLNRDDPYVTACIKELLDEFKGEVDHIKIRATLILT